MKKLKILVALSSFLLCGCDFSFGSTNNSADLSVTSPSVSTSASISASTSVSTSTKPSTPTSVSTSLSDVPDDKTYHSKEEKNARYSYYDLEGANKTILNDYIVGKSGHELLNGLSILMAKTQTSIVSYGELKTQTALTDLDLMNEGCITTLYSRESISGEWNESLWNREHVWCKNHSNGLYTSVTDSNRGAGSDIHHIRPALMVNNSSRSNVPYGVVDKTTATQLNDTGCYFANNVFEPSDSIKGDIARILMYVYTRYSSSLDSSKDTISGKRGDLRINDIIYVSSGQEQDAWNLLLDWNNIDPVDYTEIYRNYEAEKLQGNRNVFIDHEEFADMCFASYEGEGALIKENKYLDDKVNFIGVSNSKVHLAVNNFVTIKASTFPITNCPITWESDNSNIAKVEEGKITAISVGNTIVRAKFNDVVQQIKVEVVDVEPQFKYSGEALSSGTTYAQDISKNITYKDHTVNVTASVGNASSGSLTLGTADKSGPSLALANLKNHPTIAMAMGISNVEEQLKVAALIFEGDLLNINKITFSYNSIKAYTNMYIMYSTDGGLNYQVITVADNLLPSSAGKEFVYEFEKISQATFALGFISNSTYMQIKKPVVSFYN